MKILVLGAGGMAGHVVATQLREEGYVVDTLSANNTLDDNTFLVDVTKISELERILDRESYDAVINCIALLVQPSEDNKAAAVYLNSYLPHYLETYYEKSKTKVVHISTDDVFSGENHPYLEDSPHDGRSFYGRSKALGELDNSKDVTFRTSIIGPALSAGASGLLSWFLRQDGEIFGYKNVTWNGITTIELAKCVHAAIVQDLTGIYNLVPAEGITKFDLLTLFKDTFDRQDITVSPSEGNNVDKSLVDSRKDLSRTIPDYPSMIMDMKTWMEDHPNLYEQYKR